VTAPDAPKLLPFVLRLTCCGRDDGVVRFATWREADDFREGYLSGVGVGPPTDNKGGHSRSAIIVEGL
jgi:hypothetical protein